MADPGEVEAMAATLSAQLAKWDGCICELASYHFSHSHFEFRLYHTSRRAALRIVCHIPHHYCGPLGWHQSHLRVLAAVPEPGLDKGAVLVDEPHGLAIRCHSVQLSEGPRPHWLKAESDAPPP